jgi:hypothetical protein
MVTKTKNAGPPPTMAEVQERKTRERLTAYRHLVARAAAGEQLRDEDMGTASNLLDDLGLPPYAWARDVQAKRDDDAAAEQETGFRAAEPDRLARERDAAERVKALEDELKTMRQRLHQAATAEPMRLMNVLRQRNELRANHPHVLADLEQAVAFRLQAKRKTMTPAGSSPADGWSMS